MERQWNATSKLQLLLVGRRKIVSSGHATLAIQDDGTSWLSTLICLIQGQPAETDPSRL